MNRLTCSLTLAFCTLALPLQAMAHDFWVNALPRMRTRRRSRRRSAMDTAFPSPRPLLRIGRTYSIRCVW